VLLSSEWREGAVIRRPSKTGNDQRLHITLLADEATAGQHGIIQMR